METHHNRGAVHGILEQFRELGELEAVSLLDGTGRAVASAGDRGATAALAESIARLLRGMPGADGSSSIARLFEDGDELIAVGDAATMSLLLRRVGDEWALAAIWSVPEVESRLRSLAAETARRLEGVS